MLKLNDANNDVNLEVRFTPSSGTAVTDRAKLTVGGLDLDIDSDNNNGFDRPTSLLPESAIEEDPSLPGKYLTVNDGDDDNDGVSDLADGYNRDGTASNADDVNYSERFVPLTLVPSRPLDLSVATFRLQYSGSDPAAVTESGGVFTPAPGHLRLWRVDGNFGRRVGDYFASGTYTADALGIMRGFPSARKTGMPGNEFSATSHVDDQTVIDAVYARNADAVEGDLGTVRTLAVGGTATYSPYVIGQMGVTDGSDQTRLLQMMFEGVRSGSGKLIFEVMHSDQVVSSSSIDLRLRPMKQLYDHYTVGYGPNVMSDGTFREDVDPLDQVAPVPTTAQLVDYNLERSRFQSQSDDYFVFVNGWRLQAWERLALAESAYKRMFWSGFKGQFGAFTWPTHWVDKAVKDAGNFDRSEFIGWNSAAGLSDALQRIRDVYLTSTGELSVMAHSLENLVLGEALYLNKAAGAAGNKLVDTAIMSQAAVSSHYFNNNKDQLPLIYTSYSESTTNHVYFANPNYAIYRGFAPYGEQLDVIGGATPRFMDIDVSAGKLLNYYNPDDYALATWKWDQALKPTNDHSLAYMGAMKTQVDFGNVSIGGSFMDLWEAANGRQIPGYANTTYTYNAPDDKFYRVYHRYDAEVGEWTEDRRTGLSLAANRYEMFAFAASSIFAPVGTTPASAMPGVFSDDVDVRTLDPVTRFTTENTGHSAQFVHTFSEATGYWQTLLGDISIEVAP